MNLSEFKSEKRSLQTALTQENQRHIGRFEAKTGIGVRRVTVHLVPNPKKAAGKSFRVSSVSVETVL